MKLSELEKLSDELLSGVPEDMIERNWTQEAILCLNTMPAFCTTFREMLEALQCCKERLDGYDDADRNWLNDTIKKAEEML